MDCQYCKSLFSTNSALLLHQKSAKYCIKIQQDINPQVYKCDGCKKVLSTKHRLSTHKLICKKIIEKVPENTYREKVNAYIDNMEILTDEFLAEKADSLSETHVKKGPAGYAEFASVVLKNKVINTDVSREIFKFKTKYGITVDQGAEKIGKMLCRSIDRVNKDLIERMGACAELDTMITLLSTVSKYKNAITKGSRGEITPFYRNFSKHLSLLLSSHKVI
jgi:hypothetical protein